MLEQIIEKLDSIPIFFDDEKKYLISKIKDSGESFLEEFYLELCKIEENVKKDWPEISKKIENIVNVGKLEIETKKNQIIKDIIKLAEKKEKEEENEIDLDNDFPM